MHRPDHTPDTPAPPLDDGTLVRWMDGELDAHDEGAVTRAIEHDPELRARVEELRASASLLRTSLSAWDPGPAPDLEIPAPPSTSAPPARAASILRAAAVALLVCAGVVAAVPGLRATVVAGARGVVSWILSPTVRTPGSTERPAPPAVTRVGFPVEGPTFTLRLQSMEEGILTVRRSGSTGGSLEARGGAAEIRVGPDGVEVENAGAYAGALELRLPQAVEVLILEVGAASARRISLRSLEGGTFRVPLGAP